MIKSNFSPLSTIILAFLLVSCNSDSSKKTVTKKSDVQTNVNTKPTCIAYSQKNFVSAFDSLTKENVEKLSQQVLPDEGNSLKVSRLIDNYDKELNKLLCYEYSFTFRSKVSSINSTTNNNYFQLVLINHRENDLMTNDNGPLSGYNYGYHYLFSEESQLANKISNLAPGDSVEFRFKFIKNNSHISAPLKNLKERLRTMAYMYRAVKNTDMADDAKFYIDIENLASVKN